MKISNFFFWKNIFKKIQSEILWENLIYAFLSWLPILITSLLFNEQFVLRVGLIEISLFIVSLRLKFNIFLTLFHYGLIILGFSLMYFLMDWTTGFALVCACMACATVFITRYGHNLRSFGNFTFIPSLYLACEIHHGLSPQEYVSTYFKFIAWSPLALLFFIFFQYTFQYFEDYRPEKKGRTSAIPCKIKLYELNRGEPLLLWLPPTLAIFFGVFISALLAHDLHLKYEEWFIWSTASVITTDFLLSKNKFHDRFCGALIGAALGLCVSYFLPKNEYLYSISILAIMLTLISFKTYFVAVIFRVFFIVTASSTLNQAPEAAFHRLENVFLGGLIGFCFTYLFHYCFERQSKRL